jgi:hypothetical protein
MALLLALIGILAVYYAIAGSIPVSGALFMLMGMTRMDVSAGLTEFPNGFLLRLGIRLHSS